MNAKLLWQRVLDAPAGWGVLVFGAAAIALGGPQVVDSLRFVESAHHTTGVIVEVEPVNGDEYRPIVEFADVEGRQLRFASTETAGERSHFQVGQTVGVLYAPDDPADARLDTWQSRWASDSIVPALGALLVVLGIAGLVKNRRRQRPPSRNRLVSTPVESHDR